MKVHWEQAPWKNGGLIVTLCQLDCTGATTSTWMLSLIVRPKTCGWLWPAISTRWVPSMGFCWRILTVEPGCSPIVLR